MNQNLFQKIVGEEFHITNFKVESLEDLKAVIEKQEKNLNLRVFNTKAECYELKSSEISPDNNGILELIIAIALGDLYSHGLNYLPTYQKEILTKLTFKKTDEDKSIFFKDEFHRIEKLFLANPYFELLTPDNYFNEINSRDFITNLWNSLKRNNAKAFSKWKKEMPKNIDDLLCPDEDMEKSIHSLFIYLGEYSILKIEKSKFDNRTEKDTMLKVREFYPQVFSSPKVQYFFIFCMKHYENADINKTLLSKYFDFFTNDDFILQPINRKYFFKFVQKELQVSMTRIEPYTSNDAPEHIAYQSMKKIFFPEYL